MDGISQLRGNVQVGDLVFVLLGMLLIEAHSQWISNSWKWKQTLQPCFRFYHVKQIFLLSHSQHDQNSVARDGIMELGCKFID